MERLREEDGWVNMVKLPAAQQRAAESVVRSTIRKLHSIRIPPTAREPGRVVHGDLRTTNVMLRRGPTGSWSDAEVKIIDWDCECLLRCTSSS
jgi:aminoglycoside phosphotransferase (APT) family kinase protein